MPVQTNTNVSPYYDDFDPRDNYHRVMFKPGYPVQARELTQLQTILSDQIEKIGSKILRTGDTVIPGGYGINVVAAYVRVATITQGATAKEFIGYTLTGVTSGVKATVNFAEEETDDDDITFFVNYKSSGNSTEQKTFIEGETLESDTPNFYTANVGLNTVSKPISTPPMGQGSVFNVEEGHFYVDGTVVRADKQIISLDKYGSVPTYKVGFVVDEDFITSNDDTSLLDNSQGSSNFAAPGADRIKISLTLAKRPLNPVGPAETDPHFVYLVDIVEGLIQGAPNQTAKWDWLYKLLAKRTYDESGDYIISDFAISPLEYWNTATIDGEQVDVRGVFNPDEDGLYDPIPTEDSTQKLTFSDADNNYAISSSAGKAIVQGYSVGYDDPFYVYGKKARTENLVVGTSTQINPGLNIPITNVHGLPDIENALGSVNTSALKTITTYRNFGDGHVGSSVDGVSEQVRYNAGHKPPVTYHFTVDIKVPGVESGDTINITNSITGDFTAKVVFSNGLSFVVDTMADYAISSTENVVRRGEVVSVTTSAGSSTSRVITSFRIDSIPTGVITPKYINTDDLVNSADGELYSIDSSFELGIVSSSFFTELLVEAQVNADIDWLDNDIIVGSISGATGKIVPGSSNTLLIVSDIVGEFKNNENIIQTSTGKSARILRPGEVSGFVFDDYLSIDPDGNESNSGGGGGGNGGNSSGEQVIFSPDVKLVYEQVVRARLYPNEEGLETQEQANIWFYEAIKSLQAGDLSSKIYLTETPPVTAIREDIWIHSETYDMYVWTGDYWIALTESANEIDLTQFTTVDTTGSYSANQTNITTTAEPRTYDNFDLSRIEYLYVSAVGAGIKLDPGADKDFVHDPIHNKLEITPAGRAKIYNFPYFSVERDDFPRVDLTVSAFSDNNTKFIRGYCLVFPDKITNTLKKVKSFHHTSLGSPDHTDFTADISIGNTFNRFSSGDSEITSLASGSLFSGLAGRNYVTCDTFFGDPSEEIIAGDLVTITNDGGGVESKIVMFATTPYGYGQNRAKSVIYFTTTLLGSVSGKTVERIRVKSSGNADSSLIVRLPVSTVSSIENDPDITGIDYQVYRQFISSVEAGSTDITISSSKANEFFLSQPNRILITTSQIINGTDDQQLETEGRLLRLADSGSITLQDDGRRAVITLNEAVPYDFNVKIIAPVQVTNAKSKRKIVRKNFIVNATMDPTDPDNYVTSPASQSAVSLHKTDIIKLNSVKMERTSGQLIDVTNNYDLDNGQRSDIYDIGLIILKPQAPTPTGRLEISFDYFEHDSDGDFFSVNSYTHDEGVPYGDIPVFEYKLEATSKDIIDRDPGRFIQLRDCIDFRSTVNTLETDEGGTDSSTVSLLDRTRPREECTNFRGPRNGGNGTVCRVPLVDSQFNCDVVHYLPKIDSLFLTINGNMIIESGLPSESPVRPADLSVGIRLYDIYVPAYTFNVSDLTIKKYDYRRYTMKDIDDINNRLTKVQDLVTLSLLEQEAVKLSVRDAVTGLERFKNGVIVDNFRDHSKGDVGKDQYRNSIDPESTHLRPPFGRDQVTLEEVNQTELDRLTFGNYRTGNGIATIDYENVDLVTQPDATRFINCQPYTVFTYEGRLTLNPDIDTYQDTNILPAQIIRDDSVWDAMRGLADGFNNMGTVWGEWTTQSTQTQLSFIDATRNGRADGSLDEMFSQTSSTMIQQGFNANLSLGRARTIDTSQGDRVVDVNLARTMRSIPVRVTATRLKPDTRYYVFFDSIEVSDYMSIDEMETGFDDGTSRYTGSPNSNPKGFGHPIISDSTGTITGVFLIPNGRAPVKGQILTGGIDSLQFRTSGPERNFNSGQRLLVLTSSPTNESDLSQVDGIASKEFTSSGVIQDKQETIISTRIPESPRLSFDTQSRTRTTSSGRVQAVAFDPVAQTFTVDESFENGVFLSEIDVFFRTKDATEQVEVYVVTMDGESPTDQIIPHSRVTKTPDTILRVLCDLKGLSTAEIAEGVTVVGQTSQATGIIKTATIFESESFNPNANVNNKVYNVLIDNYQGEFLAGETIVPNISPPSAAVFNIARDEVTIQRLDVKNFGTDYLQDTTVVTISEPDLPGGRRATAEAKVSAIVDETLTGITGKNGQVYELILIDPGTGYTKAPSVQIGGVGVGAEGDVRIVEGRSAVRIGVTLSDDSTLPTTFKFQAPVYLMGDTKYAFVVKSPTSVDYTIWTMKLGENLLGTDTRAIKQSSVGSLFMSQDGKLWTEDQTQDVKFTIRRCLFNTNELSEVVFNNAPLTRVAAPDDCIQTSGGQNRFDSTIFGENPRVAKVTMFNHGLVPGDYVVLDGVLGSPGGIPDTSFNTLHEVVDCDLMGFTIMVDYDTSVIDVESINSGGSNITCSINRPYETINLYSGVMSFPPTQTLVRSRAAQAQGVTGYNRVNQYVRGESIEIPIMNNYYYNSPKQVANYLNEVKYNDTFKLNGYKSLETRFRMLTGDDAVSPVVDVNRTNMNVIRNLVDDPRGGQSGYTNSRMMSTRKHTITFNGDISGAGLSVGSELTIGNWSLKINKIHPQMGVVEVHAGDYIMETLRAPVFANQFLSDLGVRDVSSQNQVQYLDETSPRGSTFAKWISKRLLFENECDGIEIKMSCIQYRNTDIRVYYSPLSISNTSDISQNLSWVPFNPNGSITEVIDGVETPVVGLPDNVSTISTRDPDKVDPRDYISLDWQDLVWSVQDLAKFNGLMIKIVMTSDNPALAPVIDDMRVVVSE